ncbi:MAG: lipoprotein [Gallionella sp.]
MPLRLCIIVVLVLLAQGCGRKGPLHMPGTPYPGHKTTPAPAAKPASPPVPISAIPTTQPNP